MSGIKEYSLEVLAIAVMIAGIAILVISITFLPKYQTVVIPMYRWTGNTEPALSVSVELKLPDGITVESEEGKMVFHIDNEIINRLERR